MVNAVGRVVPIQTQKSAVSITKLKNKGRSNEIRRDESEQHDATADLVSIHQVPLWLQFNRFVHHGYRRAPCSVGRSFRSFFAWHNESINVWTHFLGAVITAYVLVRELSKLVLALWYHDEEAAVEVCMWGGACRDASRSMSTTGSNGGSTSSNNVVVVVSINAILASSTLLITFVGSTIYHLLMPCCHSHNGYVLLLGCDVRASVIGIACSGLSFLLKGDPCNPTSPIRIITTITYIVAAITTLLISTYSKNVKQRMLGIGMFVGLRFICALIALTHKHAVHNMYRSVTVHYLSFLLLVVGGWFNMSRVPECKRPGQYDCFLNSHNIWHVLGLFSGLGAMLGALQDDIDWTAIVCPAA